MKFYSQVRKASRPLCFYKILLIKNFAHFAVKKTFKHQFRINQLNDWPIKQINTMSKEIKSVEYGLEKIFEGEQDFLTILVRDYLEF